jgi:hypothetical protein
VGGGDVGAHVCLPHAAIWPAVAASAA